MAVMGIWKLAGTGSRKTNIELGVEVFPLLGVASSVVAEATGTLEKHHNSSFCFIAVSPANLKFVFLRVIWISFLLHKLQNILHNLRFGN